MEQIIAQKSQQKIRNNLLKFVISEFKKDDAVRMGTKEPTDEQVIKYFTKLIEDNKKVMEKLDNKSDRYETLDNENSILTSFLPQEVEGEELLFICEGIADQIRLNQMKQMGQAMSALSAATKGKLVNKGNASAIFRKLITEHPRGPEYEVETFEAKESSVKIQRG